MFWKGGGVERSFLSMNKGEVLVIIGLSGSESTLLRCLCFLERMEKGSILSKATHL